MEYGQYDTAGFARRCLTCPKVLCGVASVDHEGYVQRRGDSPLTHRRSHKTCVVSTARPKAADATLVDLIPGVLLPTQELKHMG
jgi:hypothetical protein